MPRTEEGEKSWAGAWGSRPMFHSDQAKSAPSRPADGLAGRHVIVLLSSVAMRLPEEPRTPHRALETLGRA